MGWRDRDYAQWTDAERKDFYGSGSARNSNPRAGGAGLARPGVGLAVLVSGALFALGRFPAGHPILSIPHLGPAGTQTQTTVLARATGTINGPRTASLGSTLTFKGTAPAGNGQVTLEGSHDNGQTWQTLSSVEAANGVYTAQVTLNQRGLLQLRILFSDGSRASGSIVVQ